MMSRESVSTGHLREFKEILAERTGLEPGRI
jgi:hypothetical protein